MIEITRQSAIDGVTAIVEEYGWGYVYEKTDDRCVYVKDGSPDCLVGRFLAAQGVSIELLEEADQEEGTPAVSLVYQLQSLGVLRIKEGAIDFLQALQRQQDLGHPWGHALVMAKAWS